MGAIVISDALDELVALFELERLEEDYFRGASPDERRQRIFGGQVAGQALVAAGLTVDPARGVHSLHAYFLRPGLPGVPVLYQVDRIRDGRSFTTRRVVAVQRGRPIFNLSASFHVEEQGVSHQDPMPPVPPPATLPTYAEQLEGWSEEAGEWYTRPRPIDQRFVDAPAWATRGRERAPRQRVWIRADGRLPDDPLLHACVVAYASDVTLLDSVLMPHGLAWGDEGLMGASLDHAMWFHQPFRADEWLLYDQQSPVASGSRGLAGGAIYTMEGLRAVTVVQEGVVRCRPAGRKDRPEASRTGP